MRKWYNGAPYVQKIAQLLGIESFLRRVYWRHLQNNLTFQALGHNATFYSVDNRHFVYDIETEITIIEDIIHELRPGDVFFDIGANVGVFSVFAGLSTNDVTVIAIEPHPDNQRILAMNTTLNDVVIQSFEVALSNTTETVSLNIAEDSTGHQLGTNDSVDSINVKTITGDELIQRQNLPRPNVVKIDVEGAEGQVIEGLKNYLQIDECRVVYCEIHREEVQDFDMTASDIEKMLSSQGFTLTKMLDRGHTYFIKAKR